jgi:nicotinate-nucleotide--dimethylbenzimidazole phosphoribosyltransferase
VQALATEDIGEKYEGWDREGSMTIRNRKVEEIIHRILPVNEKFMEIARGRLDQLTKPVGSLGKLEHYAARLVAIAEGGVPDLDRKVVFTFAGDHGIAAEGVSAYPREVTPQMVFTFLNGGAAINVLARHAGAEVVVVDMGVDYDFDDTPGLIRRKVMRGTRNMLNQSAMTRDEAEECLAVGIELAENYAGSGYRLFCTGDMGIGNTTPSSAIAAVMTGKAVSEVTGRGTGISDRSLAQKIEVISESIRRQKPDANDPVDVLSKVGGTEIAGIAGLILGAAAHRIPVVIDGLISSAGALIAYALQPRVRDYMFAGHNSVEIGHRAILDKIGLQPVLDLGLRLGEGTGAVLAMFVIEGGLKIYREMATFSEAGVACEGDEVGNGETAE